MTTVDKQALERYSGGDSTGSPMDRLGDKMVAIIGTGATAVQCIPRLARACEELDVLRRTPSSVDVRDNVSNDPDWFAEIAAPGWQKRWLKNFTDNQTGGLVDEDLVVDGWTEDAGFEKMDEIRQRVGRIVDDPGTAEAPGERGRLQRLHVRPQRGNRSDRCRARHVAFERGPV